MWKVAILLPPSPSYINSSIHANEYSKHMVNFMPNMSIILEEVFYGRSQLYKPQTDFT